LAERRSGNLDKFLVLRDLRWMGRGSFWKQLINMFSLTVQSNQLEFQVMLK
jgi:hypothetical protein